MRTEFSISTAANLNYYDGDMEYLLVKVEEAVRDAITEDLADYCVNNLGDWVVIFTVDLKCQQS
jgi:hypothetical protein